jgi:hypothetical protein
VYQRIINEQPPHQVYIEPFLGAGAILRHKRPAECSIGIDLDEDLLQRWVDQRPIGYVIEFYNCDALKWLRTVDRWPLNSSSTLIYCDPPYPLSTRGGRRYYRHELHDREHEELLSVLRLLPCMIQISGYRCEIYDEALINWRRIDYEVMTRGGRLAIESLWMNYPRPTTLHTTWFAGSDFRERERIKRKRDRWVRRLSAMEPAERQVIAEALAMVTAQDSDAAPCPAFTDVDNAGGITNHGERQES